MPAHSRSLGFARARQAWTIARIELRRAFFAKRSFWVYGLALLPSVIFLGHGIDVKTTRERLARRGVTAPALMDSISQPEGATVEKVDPGLASLTLLLRFHSIAVNGEQLLHQFGTQTIG